MYAIVDIGGVQYKVSKSMKIRVPKMEVEPGKSIELNKVLLLVDNDDVQVGKPTVANVSIKANVISHGKDKKVIVFKKKRKKNYRVLRGHRQQYTELQIDQIATGKTAAAKTEKAAAPAQPKAKEAAPAKPAVKKSVKSVSKPAAKSTTKTSAPQKQAAKTASSKPKTVKKTGASKEKKE
jgi:large subunit ribosomal protein L21